MSADDKLQKYVDLLKDGRDGQRLKAVQVLYKKYKVLGESSVSALFEALLDPYWEVRLWAIRALLLNGADGLMSRIPHLLTDKHKKVRLEAAVALQKSTSPDAPDVIKECSEMDLQPDVRKVITKLMQKIVGP